MRRLLVLLTTLLLAAVAAGCGGGLGTGDTGFVSGSRLITRLDPADRRKPGPVSGTTLEGTKVDLASYAGKTVVINVWGSWCSPCRQEAPALAGAARDLAGDDVVFLGINTKDSSVDQGLAFERRYDVPYKSLFDPSGRNLLSFRGTLNPSAIPSTVVIDPQGRVAASVLDRIPSRQTLVDLVRDVQQ